MKLASYNIRKAVGRDRRRDPGRVIEVINSLGADVVVLQEADRRLGPRPTALPRKMLEDHSDYVPAPLAANDVSLGWHGNAVLVRRGLEITDTQRIELPSLEPRGAVSVEIDGKLRIAGTHLALMRRYRHPQMRALRAALARGETPTVVLGDFNEWSLTLGMEELHHGFETNVPGATYPTFRPVAALDRIALSPEVKLKRSGVHVTELSRIASDHLPIWAEVSLPAAAVPEPRSAVEHAPGAPG
ncbi:MAG: endonuclease/exonuclease/phosphatase family protein [Maritimibacter harenae]|jgi:endonuclease/exonuclease/phosphatase family metal-dependent hydrolase